MHHAHKLLCVVLLFSGTTYGMETSQASNDKGRQTIQNTAIVMICSGLVGQAIKSLQHDTGLRLYNVKVIKQVEAFIGSFLVAYILSDLADDGKVNCSTGQFMGSSWKETALKTLQIAYKKALWTVPAYIGWIGLDQMTQNDESTEE